MGAAPFVVEIDLGVPRQADHRRFEHGLPREELWQVGADDVLEQDERIARAVGHRHEAGESGGHLHDRQPRGGLAGAGSQTQGEIQAQRGEQRERSRLVDAERGQDREHTGTEVGVERQRAISEAGRRPQPDASLGQLGQQLVPRQRIEARDERMRPLPDQAKLLGGGQAREVTRLVAGRDGLLQCGHPHHEELVEIRRGNRHELDALEQRRGGIGRFFDHPFVEREPRQLAVQVERAGDHVGGHSPPAAITSCRPKVATNRSDRADAANRSIVMSPVPSSCIVQVVSRRTS